MKNVAYFDNAATTMTLPEVVEEMLPYFSEHYGNPSSLYSMGGDASDAIKKSRKRIANALNSLPSEIIFTAGGTESDNMALLGAVPWKGKAIASAIEHSAILETGGALRRRGGSFETIPVDKEGFIDFSVLDSMMKDVDLLSVMAANNVVGTIQNIRECAKIAHENNALFHTDAVQGFTKMDIDVKRDGIDLLSISSHKIHGPKGVGVLYVKSGVEISPIVFGGGQEMGLRSSTENVPGIVGIGKATEIAISGMSSHIPYMTKIRDEIIDSILEIPGSALNGPRENRLCNNCHFRFDNIKGNELVMALDRKGIAVSTASACSAGDTEPSHVLTALGLNQKEAMSALRVTISHLTTREEIDLLLQAVPEAVSECR